MGLLTELFTYNHSNRKRYNEEEKRKEKDHILCSYAVKEIHPPPSKEEEKGLQTPPPHTHMDL